MNFEWKLLFFCSETRVFHQKFLFSAQKRVFFIRNYCILKKNRSKLACMQFVHPSFGGAGGGSPFSD